MKTIFNFLQIANWLYICRQNLENIKNMPKNTPKEEIIKKLIQEKRKLEILKDIINKKNKIHGINSNFLKKLDDIKKDYGIIE